MATRGHAAHRGLLWILCLFFWLPSVEGQCARFEFPGSKTTQDCDDCDMKLTVQNSHDVVLPFTLRTDNCSSSKQFFSITVTRKNASKSTPSHVCKLRVVNGECIAARKDVCPCGHGKGRYSLRMNVGDRDTLTWRTNDSQVASKTTVRIRLEDSSAASTKTGKRVVSSDVLLPDDVTLIDGNTSGKGQGETDEKRNDDQDDSSVRIIVIVVVGVVVVVLVAVLVLIVVKLRRVKSSETDGQLRSAGRTYFREVQSSVLREDMTASVYGEAKGDSHYPHFADSPPPTVDVDDLPPPWTTAMASSTEDGSGSLPSDQLQPLGGLLHRFDF